MKHTVILAIALLTVSFGYAQKMNNTSVPKTVSSAFKKANPTIKRVNWDKEGSNYEASYKVNHADRSLLITKDGKIMETEISMPVNQLPQKVKDYVAKNYPSNKIKEAAKITNDKGVMNYEAEVKGMDLLFDTDGNFVREAKD